MLVGVEDTCSHSQVSSTCDTDSVTIMTAFNHTIYLHTVKLYINNYFLQHVFGLIGQL